MSAVIIEEPSVAETVRKQAEIREKFRALNKLMEDDVEDQRETYEFLKQALNESRSSYRKVFVDDDCLT